MKSNLIFPPYTQDEIDSINGYQEQECFHNYRCFEHQVPLVAQEGGLYCPQCDWVQTYCLRFIGDFSWKNFLAKEE